MAKVYFASKMHHAVKWKGFYDHPDIHVVSRWPFLETFVEPTPANAKKFWLDDHADVTRADVVIVYAEEGEHLRGALIEAGIGIALGKRIIVVGDHPDYGTWQHHPQVQRAISLENALALVKWGG
jgi:hypothetical protein